MKALVLERPSEPSGLRITEVPRPRADRGEVVLEVGAAAVNRSDTLNVRGLPLTVFPRITGRDFAGKVIEGPPALLGRHFWGTGSGDLGFIRDGSHAQYMVLPESALVPLPEGLPLPQAGAAGLSYLAACYGLSKAGINRESAVLVTGAAGGVGSAALAVARWQGGEAIAAVLDKREEAAVRRAFPGVETVITSESPLDLQVAERTGGRGVDIVFDTVGTALFEAGLSCLGSGGRFVAITAAPGKRVPLDLSSFYIKEASLLSVNTGRADSTWCAEVLTTLLPGFESGHLPAPEIAQELPLDECSAAFAAVEQGTAGRVVFVN